jgi:hypothetical protein
MRASMKSVQDVLLCTIWLATDVPEAKKIEKTRKSGWLRIGCAKVA